MRFHTSLPVRDIEATENFYREVLGSAPVKKKADYLKFLTPNLNISFQKSPNFEAPLSLHLGFEVQDRARLDALYERLERAGLITEARETSVCCYASQDKFWVTDPTGYRWELYVLLEDTEQRIDPVSRCCAEARAGRLRRRRRPSNRGPGGAAAHDGGASRRVYGSDGQPIFVRVLRALRGEMVLPIESGSSVISGSDGPLIFP